MTYKSAITVLNIGVREAMSDDSKTIWIEIDLPEYDNDMWYVITDSSSA
jgi:hypothetical protein